MKRNDRVKLRIQIVDMLYDSLDDRNKLVKALNKIQREYKGYTVDLQPEPLYIYGTLYKDSAILIKEDGHRFAVIYKDKEYGKLMIDVNSYDLMTDEEIREEREEELRAEAKMNAWSLGYRDHLLEDDWRERELWRLEDEKRGF